MVIESSIDHMRLIFAFSAAYTFGSKHFILVTEKKSAAVMHSRRYGLKFSRLSIKACLI